MRTRRVVSQIGADGQTYFSSDGPAPTVVNQPGRALTFYELWATNGVDGDDDDDPATRLAMHHPPAAGTVFRIVELLPDTERDADRVEDDLLSLGAAGIRVDNDDATFHRNTTVDYNLILAGEMYLVTETAETRLGPGDVVIQRGTAHTWSNRSDAPCTFASVMVAGADRDE